MPSPFIGRGEESSSGGSSDFFSPVAISFFRKSQSEPTKQQRTSLNTSWIGARLSPIQSFDNDCCEGNDANHADIEERHSSLEDAPFVTERTNLLFGQRFGKSLRRNATSPYRLHPLWKRDHHDGPAAGADKSATSAVKNNDSIYHRNPFPIFLCWVSGLNLLSMGIYDLTHILGLVTTTSSDTTNSAESHLWALPALTPPNETLFAFGCYDRFAYSQMPFWRSVLRMATSTVVCTSVVDWLLLCVSWNMISTAHRSHFNQTTLSKTQPLSSFMMSHSGTVAIFAITVLFGLLWAMAYDSTTYSTPLGLATAGTAGVLGNIGSRDISQRYPLYCMNVVWLLLSLAIADHSVFAMAGSIALGSALGFTTMATTFPVEMPAARSPAERNQSQQHCSMAITWIATACAVAIVMAPVLTLAFPRAFGMMIQ